jgi:hypothetical protein
MSPGPSCPIGPFSTESSGTEINTWVQGTPAREDVARREPHRVYSERLWSRRRRRRVEGDPELACPGVVNAERPPPGTLASADQNILHPFQVSIKGKGKETLPTRPWLPLSFLISSHLCLCCVCFRGRGGYACVIDGVDSGVGGGECCGAGICLGRCRGSRP